MKTIKRPTHNDEFTGNIEILRGGEILIRSYEITYKYKGFIIAEAGKAERLIKRFDENRIELKAFYRVLNESEIDISPSETIWTLQQARFFIDSIPGVKRKRTVRL